MFILNKNMMITPISFNSVHKNNNIQRNNTNTIAFSGLKLEDFFDGNHETFNNALINYEVVNGDFAAASRGIQKAGKKYNPNYYDSKTNAYLLSNVCFPKKLKAKIKCLITSNQENYRSILIDAITSHSDFDPNRRIPGRRFSKPYTTYIEEAIRHNDAELMMHLCERVDLEDPFEDDFHTLLMMTSKNHLLRHHLNKAILIQKALNKSEEADDENDSLYEDDDVKEYRAEILDSVPDSIDAVGGLTKAKQAITDFIIKPWSNNIRQQLKANNIAMPNGFLMYGPPGCGKTYIAKVIAKQTGFPMYEVDLSNVGSSMGYKTSNTLRTIFSALESQYRKNNIPNILFLDEIDSIAASREDTNTDWKRDDINTLISLLNNASEKGIIVIGATNLLDNVDQAVLRTGRFDKKIEISLPSEQERKDILEKLIGMKKIALDLLPHIDKLAASTDGKTCSDISAIVNECCRQAIYHRKKKITVKDFEKSLNTIEENSKKERPKIGF